MDDDERRKLVSNTLEYVQADVNAKSDRTTISNRARRYWGGDFYSTSERQSRKRSYSSRNLSFLSVEDGTPLLTDVPFRLAAEPRRREASAENAEAMTEILDWIRETELTPWLFEVVARDLLSIGLGVLKVGWDPELDYPHGRIVNSYIDPADIYLDSSVKAIRDINRITQIGYRSISEMSRLYPKEEEEIIARRGQSTMVFDPTGKAQAVLTVARAKIGTDMVSPQENFDEQVLVIESYRRDDSVLLADEEDGIRKRGDLASPGAWLMTVIADNHLCYHGRVPYWDQQHPYVLVPGFVTSDKLYPKGILEFLFDVQDDENRRVSRINDWLRFMVYCMTVIKGNPSGLEALQKAMESGNYEGKVLTLGEGAEMVRVPPPDLPEHIFGMGVTNREFAEQTTGFREVLLGREPRAGESGKAIQSLQESGLTRVRLLAKHLDNAFVEVGRKNVARAVQYCRTDRWIKIAGSYPLLDEAGQPVLDEKGGAVWRPYKFANINPNRIRPQALIEAARERAKEKEETLTPEQEDDVWERELASEPFYDVILESGAAVGVARKSREDLAWALWKEKIYTAEDLLNAVHEPRAKEIAAKYEARMNPQPPPQVQGAAVQPAPGEVMQTG